MADKINDDVRISKYISLILRHKPKTIGISLNEHGWADIRELISVIKKSGKYIDMEILERVVAENDKQRFCFSTNQAKTKKL